MLRFPLTERPERRERRDQTEGEVEVEREQDGCIIIDGYLLEFATESLRVWCRCSRKQGAINLATKNPQYPSKAFAAIRR